MGGDTSGDCKGEESSDDCIAEQWQQQQQGLAFIRGDALEMRVEMKFL